MRTLLINPPDQTITSYRGASGSAGYGGVFPTHHDERVLAERSGVDMAVRAEGEATAAASLGVAHGDR